MTCFICGIQIDSPEEAVEEGWTTHYYDLSKKAGKVSGKTGLGNQKNSIRFIKTLTKYK